MDLDAKYLKLRSTVDGYGKVAVAFSGGVDSSLLLFVCCDVLGGENVIGLQAVSCLLSADVIHDAKETFKRCTGGSSGLRHIEFFPLEWDGFARNSEERCYICKKNIYAWFVEMMKNHDCDYLLDGTNVNDCNEKRPGLKAIRELNVQMPLSAAGLNKVEIRKLAKKLGLANHDLPSNSCLATRIPHNIKITHELLMVIEEAESVLKRMDFYGCRFRPIEGQAVIEVQEEDFSRVVKKSNRDEIVRQFKSLGFERIRLDLIGRTS